MRARTARTRWIRLAWAVVLILAVLLLVRQHGASGAAADASRGERLAAAWCSDCHAIGPRTSPSGRRAPDFAAIAAQPAMTELMLKVFLRTSHPTMPNLIIEPADADALAQYILGLRR
jgi:mono/diheme cytochrome c family protein